MSSLRSSPSLSLSRIYDARRKFRETLKRMHRSETRRNDGIDIGLVRLLSGGAIDPRLVHHRLEALRARLNSHSVSQVVRQRYADRTTRATTLTRNQILGCRRIPVPLHPRKAARRTVTARFSAILATIQPATSGVRPRTTATMIALSTPQSVPLPLEQASFLHLLLASDSIHKPGLRGHGQNTALSRRTRGTSDNGSGQPELVDRCQATGGRGPKSF